MEERGVQRRDGRETEKRGETAVPGGLGGGEGVPPPPRLVPLRARVNAACTGAPEAAREDSILRMCFQIFLKRARAPTHTKACACVRRRACACARARARAFARACVRARAHVACAYVHEKVCSCARAVCACVCTCLAVVGAEEVCVCVCVCVCVPGSRGG